MKNEGVVMEVDLTNEGMSFESAMVDEGLVMKAELTNEKNFLNQR